MSINVKVTPTECVQNFRPYNTLRGYVQSEPASSFVDTALSVTPPIEDKSPIREITWMCNIPVVATDAGRSNFQRLVDEVLGLAGSVVGNLSNETGFASGAAIASQLGRTVTNIDNLLEAKFDQREIAVRTFQLEFERGGDDEGASVYYGYVLGMTARWLREDIDDPLDLGYVKCERLEDTLIYPLSGEKKSNETPGRTGLFDSPLLAAGPFTLPSEIDQVGVSINTTALTTIDFEFFTTELFMTVVQELKLKIYAGTREFVDGFVHPKISAVEENKEVGAAIDRMGARLERGLRASQRSGSGASNAERAEAAALLQGVRRGEIQDARRILGELPPYRLARIAEGLEVSTAEIEGDPNRLTKAILGRLYP